MTVDVDLDEFKDHLFEKAVQCLKESENNRILIAVAGIPGSGKSTVAKEVAKALNKSNCKLANSETLESVVVGMDGYHFPRSNLRQMEDADYAFKRRGAPFTFDSHAFVEFIRALNDSCKRSCRPTIMAPSFDHKIKDPIPDGVIIPPSANVIIIEGLYLLLNQSPWDQIYKMVDQTWFVKVDLQVAKVRLAKRHLEAGIEKSLEASYQRVESNDTLNATLILNNLMPDIDVVIS